MKICFFTGDVTRCGGTERMSIMLANHLAAVDGFQVVLLSLCESAGKTFFPVDGRVRREVLFPGPAVSLKKQFVAAVWKLRRFLRREKMDRLIDVDVILALLSLPASAGLPCRRIEWEHFHYREDLGCRLRSLARRIIKQGRSPIVTLTRADAAQYGETPLRAPVLVIPNPVPDEFPCGEPAPVLPDAPFVFSVGRFTSQKGFDLIPALAQRFLKAHPGWRWVIAGDGPDRSAVEADVRARGLADRLFFPGWVNPYPYYRGAAFLVMPSRFEGFGLNLLEALSQRCPVIAFDCSVGPAEIVRNGVNGFLVPPLDTDAMYRKMVVLAEDPDLRDSMARAAAAEIAGFAPDRITALWQTLLAK